MQKSVVSQNMASSSMFPFWSLLGRGNSIDWPCFKTRQTSASNYWRQKERKSKRGWRRIQLLHDLANDGGFGALKQAAEDREGWRHRERMLNPALQQKTTDNGFPACVQTLIAAITKVRHHKNYTEANGWVKLLLPIITPTPGLPSRTILDRTYSTQRFFIFSYFFFFLFWFVQQTKLA